MGERGRKPPVCFHAALTRCGYHAGMNSRLLLYQPISDRRESGEWSCLLGYGLCVVLILMGYHVEDPDFATIFLGATIFGGPLALFCVVDGWRLRWLARRERRNGYS